MDEFQAKQIVESLEKIEKHLAVISKFYKLETKNRFPNVKED